MAEKYLKYKNKYLNLKKQFGGSEDEFPKLVFDKFIIESCLKQNSLIFDTENYEKLKEFFLNIQNSIGNKLYPDDRISETNFIGKTSYVKEDIKKIWSRLSDIPQNRETNLTLEGLYFTNGLEKKYPITDFIKIFNSKIIVGAETFDTIYNRKGQILLDLKGISKSQIITGIVSQNLIKYGQSKDQTQVSAQNGNVEPIEKNTASFKIFLNKLLGDTGTEEKFKDPENPRREWTVYTVNNFIAVYRESDSITLLSMFYIDKKADHYLLFPLNYSDILVNNRFEDSLKKLFEGIKNKLEDNLNDDLAVLQNYTNNILLDKGDIYLNSNILDLETGYEKRKEFIEKYMLDRSTSQYNSNDLGFISNPLKLTDEKKKESLCIFNLILTQAKLARTYYKILPDGFFHIHVTPASNKYVLLTIHADVEIIDNKCERSYKFVDNNGRNHNLERRKIESDEFEGKKTIFKRHNAYLLFNLVDNNNIFYSVNDLEKCKNIFINGLALSEVLFGTNIVDINHINSFGVLVMKTKKRCEYFCEKPNDYSNFDAFNHIYSKENLIDSDGLLKINDEIFVTNNKVKCAVANTKKKGELFIEDILVSNKFKSCNQFDPKIPGIKILKKYVQYAKNENLYYVTLDDDSYLQIPQIYYESSDAPIKQCYINLFNTPLTPSIYLAKFNFKSFYSGEKWYLDWLSHLKIKVNEYKLSNPTVNFNNAIDLMKAVTASPTKNIISTSEYKTFYKNYIDFKSCIDKQNKDYIIANLDTILASPTVQGNLLKNNENLDDFKQIILNYENTYGIEFTYQNCIKTLVADKFYLNKFDFDSWLGSH